MYYRITRCNDPEMVYFVNSELHPFTVSFSFNGIYSDISNISKLISLGVPSSITGNEELENYYSIFKKDFPTEQSLHDCLYKLGFIQEI